MNDPNNTIESKILGSSTIDYIVYFKEEKELYITFKAGTTYKYYDVPIEVIKGFMESRSAGTYFSVKIRNIYKYEKQ